MATAVSVSQRNVQIMPRSALIASADRSFRKRLCAALGGLRWHVREADGAAQAWGEAMETLPQTIIVDSWLPDLDVNEFLSDFHKSFPSVDIVTSGNRLSLLSSDGPFRHEVLYALRHAEDTDTAAWNLAPAMGDEESSRTTIHPVPARAFDVATSVSGSAQMNCRRSIESGRSVMERIPELVGDSACMLDLSQRIHRVASRNIPVLIDGPTGSGKELVAQAIHRLSTRSTKPLVAINCAAIPEALLEAELFGHTRGAFTGAVQARRGRIEAADGGTLFLDEIGEMPLGLQAKLLRFVESGEIQRIGDNQTVKVDVRIVAATNQPLVAHTKSGRFRPDLYYRLAVFLIKTPALSQRFDDLPLLVAHFIARIGRDMPAKRVDDAAMEKLRSHPWPGNVRELQHVLERAAILAGDESVIAAADVEFGDPLN